MKLNEVIVVLDELKDNSTEVAFFVTKDGKIDIVKLGQCFDAMLSEACRSNDEVKSAGRRFRLATTAMQKQFLTLRGVSVK